MNLYMGPLFIMFAAFLWGLDALLRTTLGKTMPSIDIVLFEHIVGLLLLSPFAIKAIKKLPKLGSYNYGAFALLALVSSVGGTLLFTEALSRGYATGDFITPLLIQKLQPLLVTGMAVILLKESLPKKFFLWSSIALVGSYLMSFGAALPESFAGKGTIVLLALGAATCWGAGTIISRTVLKQFSVIESIWYRFLFAVPITLVIVLFSGQHTSAPNIHEWARLFFIAISTGSVALLIYYRGLKRTPAHIATFAELIFPLTSIIIGITSLNPYGAAQKLSQEQVIGIALLLIGVIQIARSIHSSKHIVKGRVIKGSGDGKKLGFRTANISLHAPLFIDFGVYACTISVDKNIHNGIVHYGPRAVFDETNPQFEVHIFNFSKDVYGKTATVEVRDFIRETRNFPSTEKMVIQIKKDCEVAKKLLENS